jgi:hypothetical protein
MDEHFPGKYVVNSLPLYGHRQAELGPQDLQGKGKALRPRSAPKRGYKPAERAECSYPNTIPIDSKGRQNTDKPEEGEFEGPPDHPKEVDKIEDILTKIHANDNKFIFGTANHS